LLPTTFFPLVNHGKIVKVIVGDVRGSIYLKGSLATLEGIRENIEKKIMRAYEGKLQIFY